ncbi:MAG: hypothetical protein JW965_03155 [Bacteroidales bacterium]|nr:hypothetical protein [Bacteroidales bacterium]
MKITQKHLRLLSGFLVIAGALVAIFFESAVMNYVGIGICIVGLILLAPWIK